jgi:uncharacterized metal-binding protein/predicted Fe-Mo cluster-binding NifX family protein
MREMVVKVAIPLFGTRVSPRCLYSAKTLLVQLDESREISRKIIDTEGLSEEERLSQLVDLEIDVFVCGAIDQEFVSRAESYGISVIRNVAAEIEEVLSAIRDKTLENGYGLENKSGKYDRTTDERATTDVSESADGKDAGAPAIDCVECVDRACLNGDTCTNRLRSLYPAGRYSEFQRSMEVTMDIAAETDRKLCRIAEFIYYCLGMEYKHLGVAFCVEMFKEAEILTRLLKRFFKVSTVCCKIGGYAQRDMIMAAEGVLCNPIGQARVLNGLGTDINVVVGLCVGVDFIFVRHSEAPTSTLFVKDKSLANNPVSALYSKYYIKEILREF